MNEEKIPKGVPVKVEYPYDQNGVSMKDVKTKTLPFVKISDVHYHPESKSVSFSVKIKWWGWPIIWFGVFWDWIWGNQ